jgi:hypothetical protein
MPVDMDLLPVSSSWLSDFRMLFECFCSAYVSDESSLPFVDEGPRELSREAVFKRAAEVWDVIRDWPKYRRPLVDLTFDFWTRIGGEAGEASPAVWRVLGEEYALRLFENAGEEEKGEEIHDANITEEDEPDAEDILNYIVNTAAFCQCNSRPRRMETGTPHSNVPHSGPASPPVASPAMTSPVLSRVQSQQCGAPQSGPSSRSRSTSSLRQEHGTENLDDGKCSTVSALRSLIGI